MSRRVTTKTEIKDINLAKSALQQAGFGFEEQGSTLYITSGELRGCSIDTRTGDISGDSDYGHAASKMGALRQFYAEQKYKVELAKNGGYVEGRSVNKDGEIVLMCAIA
jgi:hypothetical protein